MSNALYSTGKASLLGASPNIDLDTDSIKAVLVAAGYTFSAAHQYLSSLGANTVGTAVALTTVTLTAGKFTSDPVSYGSPASGSTCAIVLYKDTGSAATSPLIAFLDTGTNVPVVTNGGSVTLTPHATNGWFSI